jgi:hypothetical protein
MEETNGCKNCGGPPEEGGYELRLCATCRDTLSQRPLPVWIWGVFGVVVLVLLAALARFPASVSAGVAFARGRRAEAAGDYPMAVSEYQKVADRFPDSTLALARLGIAHYRAGHVAEAVRALRALGGRETSKKLAREVNEVGGELVGRLRR